MVAQTKDFTQPTARPDLDAQLSRLRENADAWARTPVAERIALLRQFLDGYVAVAEAAGHYQTKPEERKGRVALVLGAGNVASIPPTDVLYKLFVEGKVCMLKMNPVNAHVGPFIERAFAPAVDKGWLAVSYGGP